MDTKGKRKLKVMIDQSRKVSQLQAARSFKCSQQYICKTLKKYTSVRKRQKIVITTSPHLFLASATTICKNCFC